MTTKKNKKPLTQAQINERARRAHAKQNAREDRLALIKQGTKQQQFVDSLIRNSKQSDQF